MTAKRFNIKPSAIVDDVTVIIDSEKQYTFPILDSTLNFMFCKALNELADEIEQLKQAYTQLKHRHSLLHDECIDAECDRDRYHKDVVSLEKENEQLKEEVKSLREHFIYLIGTALEDKECRKIYAEGLLEIFDDCNGLNEAKSKIKEYLE